MGRGLEGYTKYERLRLHITQRAVYPQLQRQLGELQREALSPKTVGGTGRLWTALTERLSASGGGGAHGEPAHGSGLQCGWHRETF